MQITPRDLKEAILDTISCGLVPFIKASPGVGKSQIINALAEEQKCKVIDVRLAQSDPTDLQGFPMRNGDRMDYAPPSHFPLKGDKVPEGYNGWILFLDELSSAFPAVQAAAFKLILDRMVGDHKLHQNVAIIAAGNLDSDKGVTYRISTPLQSRMVHYEMAVDNDDWQEWASHNGIHFKIKGFLKFRPELLHSFDPNHTDNTFPCPRTYEFASRLLNRWEKTNKNGTEKLSPRQITSLAGTIGEGAATEFAGFNEVYMDIPDIKVFVKTPDEAPVYDELSKLHAVCSMVGSRMARMEMGELRPLMQYMSRVPVEYQVVTLKDAIRVNGALMQQPEIQAWISANSSRLF
jgi:hypothetical protein